METYFGRGRVCSDKISDEYVSVNNFGYIKDVEYKISVKRDNGRLDYQVIYIDKGYGSFVINDEDIIIENNTDKFIIMFAIIGALLGFILSLIIFKKRRK